MATVYKCTECNDEFLRIEEGEMSASLIGSRRLCANCETTFELTSTVFTSAIDIEPNDFIGNPIEPERHAVTLPCCGQEAEIAVSPGFYDGIGFVDCAACNKAWFVYGKKKKAWRLTDAAHPALEGSAFEGGCPGCTAILGFSDDLGFVDVHTTHCPSCRQIIRVSRGIGFEKVAVELEDVELPYGCPSVDCRYNPAPIRVSVARNGDSSVFFCAKCKTRWVVSDHGREWIDLPVRPHRTRHAVTTCQSCNAERSYYFCLHANGDMFNECRKCEGRARADVE